MTGEARRDGAGVEGRGVGRDGRDGGARVTAGAIHALSPMGIGVEVERRSAQRHFAANAVTVDAGVLSLRDRHDEEEAHESQTRFARDAHGT